MQKQISQSVKFMQSVKNLRSQGEKAVTKVVTIIIKKNFFKVSENTKRLQSS